MSDYVFAISRRKAEELCAVLVQQGIIPVDKVDALGSAAQTIIEEALALAEQERPVFRA